MKNTLKTLAFVILLLNTHFFFAQQIKTENEILKISEQNHRNLDDKIAELKKQQKELEIKKKNLVKSENNLKETKNKITKLELTNQKIESKITTTSVSDEEIQKQRIKIKQNEGRHPQIKIIANNAAKRA